MNKLLKIDEGDPAKDTMPDEFWSLFGAPIFLDGEDPKLYERLREAIVEDRKPQSFMEWMDVSDLLTTLWEKMRYERAAAATIRAGRIPAVKKLAAEVEQVSSGLPRNQVAQKTCKYFSMDARERKIARAEFENFGISEAEVHATAAELNSETLQLFEKMLCWRVSYLRKVSKKAQRRTKTAAKATGGVDLNGN